MNFRKGERFMEKWGKENGNEEFMRRKEWGGRGI
jgi:hypothetical protein